MTVTISRAPYENYLICPRCRSEYLHHGELTIYDRGEDAARVTKIEVRNQSAQISKVNNAESGNPSPRRDGLAIEFRCEHCDGSLELTIAQHKGQSFIAWRGPNGHADKGA